MTVSSTGTSMYASVDYGYVYQSQDTGNTWSPPFCDWTTSAMSSNGQTSVVGTGYVEALYVYVTTDYGQTWSNVYYNKYDRTVAIACDSTCTNFAMISTYNQVYLFHDTGKTYTIADVVELSDDSDAVMQDITMSADGKVIVVCYNAWTIYYSTNAGSTWTMSNALSLNWWGIASSSTGQYVVAVTNGYSDYGTQITGGYIFVSSDYGATWKNASAPYYSYSSVSSDTTGQYLLATLENAVIQSSDYGMTWTRTIISQGYLDTVSSASSSSGQYLYVASSEAYSESQIMYSTNGGTTWNVSTASPTVTWSSVSCDSTGQYLTGTVMNGEVYVSSDYGMTWTSAGIVFTQTMHPYNPDSSSSSSLSDGAIAGIVIAAIVFCGLVGYAITAYALGWFGPKESLITTRLIQDPVSNKV
jgi:photosystem II stability/assembly factor-like uncharacterized protein